MKGMLLLVGFCSLPICTMDQSPCPNGEPNPLTQQQQLDVARVLQEKKIAKTDSYRESKRSGSVRKRDELKRIDEAQAEMQALYARISQFELRMKRVQRNAHAAKVRKLLQNPDLLLESPDYLVYLGNDGKKNFNR